MGKIKLLSDAMIGKIAAGEVVERPAAAIKELVENSLDAGASAVTVEIREGGMDLIRVTDNGSGIDEGDIRMAFERHATSKISKEQDLFSIGDFSVLPFDTKHDCAEPFGYVVHHEEILSNSR